MQFCVPFAFLRQTVHLSCTYLCHGKPCISESSTTGYVSWVILGTAFFLKIILTRKQTDRVKLVKLVFKLTVSLQPYHHLTLCIVYHQMTVISPCLPILMNLKALLTSSFHRVTIWLNALNTKSVWKVTTENIK